MVFYSAFSSIFNVKEYYNVDTTNVSITSYNDNVRRFFILLTFCDEVSGEQAV
jgi:hypothetical protein